jgi:hypothetical protein
MADIVFSTKTLSCVQSVFSYLPPFLALPPFPMPKTEALANPLLPSDKPKTLLQTACIISLCPERASAPMFELVDGYK